MSLLEKIVRPLLAGTAALVVATSVAACSAEGDTNPSPTADSSAGTDSSSNASAAEGYCTDQGGEVQERQPTFGTNNDQSSWVELGDATSVCRFQTLGDDDSRIYVDLTTLYSEQPTLAALAYLAKTQPEGKPSGNPAAALCAQIGGASSFGDDASGGGMVNTDDPIDTVFVPCTFADQSFIEEWGIAYYADDSVRGIDLADVFRFDVKATQDLLG
ncbi:hypothetical protein [Demequina oxidasica]|uniref:hypothetical protein n=1 Tax=Demequina oxidasica TaxID=676199 RepID=UPI0007812CDC|nr:hypothetical protein [Demequina oxidasica]